MDRPKNPNRKPPPCNVALTILESLIAEWVFGLKRVKKGTTRIDVKRSYMPQWGYIPHPVNREFPYIGTWKLTSRDPDFWSMIDKRWTENIADAWEVVAKMRERGYLMDMMESPDKKGQLRYAVSFSHYRDYDEVAKQEGLNLESFGPVIDSLLVSGMGFHRNPATAICLAACDAIRSFKQIAGMNGNIFKAIREAHDEPKA